MPDPLMITELLPRQDSSPPGLELYILKLVVDHRVADNSFNAYVQKAKIKSLGSTSITSRSCRLVGVFCGGHCWS